MPEPLSMRIAQVVPCTEAEGPGKRFAVWFQGCPLRCPGCCNPEFLPFQGGEIRSADELAAAMRRARDESGIEGLTLLGGEPFAQPAAGVALARAARSLDLSVMVFTGYTLEQLQCRPESEIAELIALTDILVDGPYERDKPDHQRRWIGSTNQRVHFLTSRYTFDEQWRRPNTLEVRVVGQEITINGFPAAHAVGLWKGWKRRNG
jgi:anaerobic ribonucleoside-triphosphate reductase activating protein